MYVDLLAETQVTTEPGEGRLPDQRRSHRQDVEETMVCSERRYFVLL